MFYNVLKLKDLGETDKQFEKETLMEHDNSSLSKDLFAPTTKHNVRLATICWKYLIYLSEKLLHSIAI